MILVPIPRSAVDFQRILDISILVIFPVYTHQQVFTLYLTRTIASTNKQKPSPQDKPSTVRLEKSGKWTLSLVKTCTLSKSSNRPLSVYQFSHRTVQFAATDRRICLLTIPLIVHCT